jgi:hypothetical protein
MTGALTDERAAGAEGMASIHASQLGLPVVPWCEGRHAIRSRMIFVACGDGNFYLTKLRWSRWNGHDAVGTGIGHQNLCVPDCARGRFHAYPLAVRLSSPVVCGAVTAFTRLSYRYLRAKPPRSERGGTWRFACG